MIYLGLIGKGIQRSQMPGFQEFLGEFAGFPVSYELFDSELDPEFDLKKKLEALAAAGLTGVNITHPYKSEACRCVTVFGSQPSALGAINTIVFDSNGWRGENTDYSGFQSAFRARFRDKVPGTVLILGAGGVGCSLSFALGKLGTSHLHLYDIKPERSEDLARRLALAGFSVSVVKNNLIEVARGVSGLVNASPIGMYQYPGNPLPDTAIEGQDWAFEAVYTPKRTPFVDALAARGVAVMGGFDLFIHQGLDAFEHFSGIRLDREDAVRAYLANCPQDER
ncbi:MAG: shikimate dehydrogenase [Gammaproteobacteria bacterium]|nr:shikimate dehydrogenase [Gammaproteobacteria bacterium]